MTQTTTQLSVSRRHLLERAGFTAHPVPDSRTTIFTREAGIFAVRIYLSSANLRFVRVELGIREGGGGLRWRLWGDDFAGPDAAVDDVIQFTNVVRPW